MTPNPELLAALRAIRVGFTAKDGWIWVGNVSPDRALELAKRWYPDAQAVQQNGLWAISL